MVVTGGTKVKQQIMQTARRFRLTRYAYTELLRRLDRFAPRWWLHGLCGTSAKGYNYSWRRSHLDVGRLEFGKFVLIDLRSRSIVKSLAVKGTMVANFKETAEALDIAATVRLRRRV